MVNFIDVGIIAIGTASILTACALLLKADKGYNEHASPQDNNLFRQLLEKIRMSIKELASKVEDQADKTDEVTATLKKLTQKQADVREIQATVADLTSQLEAIKAQAANDALKASEALAAAAAEKAASDAAAKAMNDQLAKLADEKAKSDSDKAAELEAIKAQAAKDIEALQGTKTMSEAELQSAIDALKLELATANEEKELANASIEHLILANNELKAAADELINAAS